MIPVKLTLRNFMSYGDEPTALPFEGLHVACLSGDNGNGKSALLDAMTWALWGKTRASSSRAITEDDLIRLGADDVEVRFEFLLNSLHYRVVKKRKRGKASDWQFAQKGSDGEWCSIGGGSQRETGKIIASVLSMEYDTFLNSAYLAQGRADEFTRQTPDNRKRILGEILGLDRYERLEAKAKERAKERKELADEWEREIRALDASIAAKPEHEANLTSTRTRLTATEAALEQQEAAWNELREKRSQLDALAGRLVDAEATCNRMDAEIARLRGELTARCRKLEEMDAVLQQKDSILRDYIALQEAERRAAELAPMLDEFTRARSTLDATIAAIEQEETRLKGDLRVLEAGVRTLEKSVSERDAVQRQLAVLAAELEDEAEAEKVLRGVLCEQEEAQGRWSDLMGRNNALKDSIQEVDEVLSLLEGTRAACPVCESDLSGEKQTRVIARQKEKREQYAAEQKQVQIEGRTVKHRQTEVAARLAEAQKRADTVRLARGRHDDLTRRLAGFGSVDAELAKAKREADTLRASLEKGEFAAPKRLHRKRLEDDLLRLNFVKPEHEAVMQRVRTLRPSLERRQLLVAAEAEYPRLTAEKDATEAALTLLAADRKTAQEKWDNLKTQLASYEALKREEAVAEADTRRLQNDANRLRADEAAFLRYIADCDRFAEQRKAKEAAFKKVDEERRLYNALGMAFGKRGVQALIIENALPELEEETNALLARMSENAMQVRFDTTRTAKSSGNEIETLDIQVMDDAGTRPYELFSGGEGFRINFAIRIALSRLLARRSGAKLQTLIMDEGFGSQDGKGREKLVEVIESIKDDFEKILVITHFEEMKDAFPQRIEVIKDANGSRIHLL